MSRKNGFLVRVPRDTAVGIAGLALGVSIGCILVRVPGGSSEWASWAQAVGAVIAVLAAVWATYYQVDNARHSAEDRDRSEILRAYGLLQSIVLRLTSDVQALAFQLSRGHDPDDFGRRQRRRESFAQIHSALLELPVHVLPDFDAVSALLDARQLSTDVLAAATVYAAQENMFTGIERDPAKWNDYFAQASFIQNSLAETVRLIQLGLR
ncbi:hypothetical protein [Burkholderia diffusa]|uniref:hypothetical protein n=1 Tax=Burkholderia diffusa TaxID=488732 RepID=UPI001583BF9D|nr:hypothetical protein [Burkholderia diffusa]